METLVSLYLLGLCINVGIGVVTSIFPAAGDINTLLPPPTDEITITINSGTDAGTQLDDTNVIVAEHVNSGSALYGETIDSVTLGLKKVGSPTGTAYICIFNSSGECTTEFGTLSVASLTTSYSERTFAQTQGTLVVNSRIGIGYTEGDASNYVVVSSSTTDQFDGTNSALEVYTTSWQADSAGDLGSVASNGAWSISTEGNIVPCESAAANATDYCRFIDQQTVGASELGSLQSGLTFGDWYSGAQMFLNIFSMGFLMNMLALVQFPPGFIFGMKLIFLFIIGVSFFYIVSSRGSKNNF